MTDYKSAKDKNILPKWHDKKGLINLLLYLLAVPITTYADVVDTLNNVLSYLTGPVGKIVATLAIVGMGYACFAMGRIAKSYFVSVIIGIAIIFGAQTLLTTIAGS